MEREFNTAEVTAAVKIHLAACLMDDVARELGRVLTRQQRQGVLRRAEGLHTLYEKAVALAGDSDKQNMVRNRARSLVVQVGYTKTAPERMFLVSERDLSHLCNLAMQVCDMECEAEQGDGTLDSRVVKGCFTRKCFKRLGVTEEMHAGCPYSLYVGAGKDGGSK